MTPVFDFVPAIAGAAAAVAGYLLARRASLNALRAALERAAAGNPATPPDERVETAPQEPAAAPRSLESARREAARIVEDAKKQAQAIMDQRQGELEAIAARVRAVQAGIRDASEAAMADVDNVAAAAAAEMVAELRRSIPPEKRPRLDELGEELDRLLRA